MTELEPQVGEVWQWQGSVTSDWWIDAVWRDERDRLRVAMHKVRGEEGAKDRYSVDDAYRFFGKQWVKIKERPPLCGDCGEFAELGDYLCTDCRQALTTH